MVGGRWLMVGGLWSVVGGWSVGSGFVLRRLQDCFYFDIRRSIRIYIPLTFFFGFPEAFKA